MFMSSEAKCDHFTAQPHQKLEVRTITGEAVYDGDLTGENAALSIVGQCNASANTMLLVTNNALHSWCKAHDHHNCPVKRAARQSSV